MCGRFVSVRDPAGVVRFFSIDDRMDDDLPPSWNVAPTDPVLAVVEHDGRRLLVAFRWGLVPAWAADPKIGSRLINARAESVAEKSVFRSALSRRRCLLPASGFYEWQTDSQGNKVPCFVHRADRKPVAFAGIWEVWRDPVAPERAPLRTCSIITTAADEQLAPLHDRMPLMLPPDTWPDWLDPTTSDVAQLRHLLRPDRATMTFHPVSPAVNRVENDHPGLLDPADTHAGGQQLQLGTGEA